MLIVIAIVLGAGRMLHKIVDMFCGRREGTIPSSEWVRVIRERKRKEIEDARKADLDSNPFDSD